MVKRVEARTSVAFEPDEQRELEAILETPRYRALLDRLIGEPRGQMWRLPRLAGGASYSTVVRALMRLGLAELERAEMTRLYLQAEAPDWMLDEAEQGTVARQVADALAVAEDERLAAAVATAH